MDGSIVVLTFVEHVALYDISLARFTILALSLAFLDCLTCKLIT